MENISGFGLQVSIIASVTFPAGILLTQFSDDQDLVDPESLQITDTAMGGNGDLLVWTTPNPIKVSLSLVADGDDDQLMQLLLNANRGAKNKIVARDVITAGIILPDGGIFKYSNGAILEGSPGTGIASGKRKKTKVYKFAFEDTTS